MQYPQFRYTPVLSEPDATWKGASGFVHEALLQAHPTLAGHEAYLSGPPVMVRAGKDACIKAGVDADHLYYDSFDYRSEEHTSELQSLMRISYAVFCLKQNTKNNQHISKPLLKHPAKHISLLRLTIRVIFCHYHT